MTVFRDIVYWFSKSVLWLSLFSERLTLLSNAAVACGRLLQRIPKRLWAGWVGGKSPVFPRVQTTPTVPSFSYWSAAFPECRRKGSSEAPIAQFESVVFPQGWGSGKGPWRKGRWSGDLKGEPGRAAGGGEEHPKLGRSITYVLAGQNNP